MLFFFFYLLLSTWQRMGLLITPTVFVTGPATWEETSFPLQIPREGTLGQLGSDTHLGLIRMGQDLLDPRVDMASGSPLLCSGKEAVANWEGHPADVHIIFIPFHRLSSSFMPFLCFLLYVHVSATPPVFQTWLKLSPFRGVLSLFHSFCPSASKCIHCWYYIYLLSNL